MDRKELRQKIMNKCSWTCVYCWEQLFIDNMQVDHIIPQRNFKMHLLHKDIWVPKFLHHLDINDINHIDNLVTSCRKCNNYKSALSLEDFRTEISRQIDRLNNTSTQYQRAKRFWLVQEINKEVKFWFETNWNIL